MVSIHIKVKLVLLLILVSSVRCCRANVSSSNDLGRSWSCESRADNLTTPTFKANLNSLLKTLKEKGPENYGFYVSTQGNKSDKMYGLVQCMGDISAQSCADCLKDSIQWYHDNCQNSVDVAIWLNRCFLRYSYENFLGQWSTSLITSGYIYNVSSNADNPSVAERGHSLMRLLSYDVLYQPFLFKTGSVDVGKKGTRYGLVQCNQDLNQSTCSYCIEDMLELYPRINRTDSSYMMFSFGCRMWYDSYKFYFNDTVPSTVPNTNADPTMPSDSGMQLQICFTTTVAVLISIIVANAAL